MAPPELAGNAPVLDVVHPLVVGVDPVFGHKLDVATLHRVDGFLGDRFAAGVVRADFRHCHKPLVGQHRLNHLAGAGAARHHQFVFFHLDQQAQGVEVFDNLFARHKAVQPLVNRWCQVVDLGVQRQHANHRQFVALADGIVVLVMRRGDFHHAGAKGLVNVVVGDDGHAASAQRQVDVLANQMQVALVFRVHHHRHVAQQGLGPGGSHREACD